MEIKKNCAFLFSHPSSICKRVASPSNNAMAEGDQAAKVIGMLSDNPRAKATSEKK